MSPGTDEGCAAVLWSPHSLSGCFSQRELRSQHLLVARERPPEGVSVSVHTTFSLGVSIDELKSRVGRALGDRLRFCATEHALKRAFSDNV